MNSNVSNKSDKNDSEWEEKFMKQFENLTEDDLIRGKTPEGVEQLCFELCQKYMSNYPRWQKYGNRIENLNIYRITGGLTNQLYYVGLKEKDGTSPEDEITIKIHQVKYFKEDKDWRHDDHHRMTDMIIAIVVSERKIGPKLYGVQPTALIQAYYEVGG